MARKKWFEVGVEEKVWERLKALAEEEGRSLSQMTNRIILLGLKHHPSPTAGEEGQPS